MKRLSIITLRTKEPIADFAKARNEELSKVKTKWILFLDKDEEMSPKLAEEIQQVLENPNSKLQITNNGYKIRRRDRFLGKWLRFGETGNVKIVKLARKDSGRWERPVHEIWKIKGKVGELKNPIYHYHNSVEEMIERIDRYSSMEAEFRKNTLLRHYPLKAVPFGRAGIVRLLKVRITMELTLYPLLKFVYNYIFRLGFLDGMEGFILAGLMSFHAFLVRSKQLERC